MSDEIKNGLDWAIEQLSSARVTTCDVIDQLVTTRKLNDAREKEDDEQVLVACPFCGSVNNQYMLVCNDAPPHRVCCSRCHTLGPAVDTRVGARTAWNNRAERKG